MVDRVDDDPDPAIAGFVEDFASELVASGVARMPARVFSCLMVSENGRLTAAELAARLQVSAAAVSGAVQYLESVHLLRRTREPGSRRDSYVVEHDVWYQAIMSRDALLRRWVQQMQRGVEVLGEGTPAGERLAESRDFFTFVSDEMEHMRRGWEERRRRLAEERAAGRPASSEPA